MMSPRILAAGQGPVTRCAEPRTARHIHRVSAGGLFRGDASIRATRMRTWFGNNAFHHAVIARNASFARFLPKLVVKFVRIPAMFGGLAIGAFAWVQYQAAQASNFAIELFGTAKDSVLGTASTIFDSSKNLAERTRQGWDSIAERVEVPEWLKKVLRIHEDMGTGGSGGPGDEGDPKQSRAGGAAVVGASAAAYGYDESDQEDPRDAHVVARDDQMMVLTKKMIEIRSILQQVGQSRSLTLPSIVVIGSQSSGKSSVLEAIVGHEFLPKGSNMVTRRPIELTLVHTPGSNEEYGEFPDLGLRHITDFSSVQRTLTELNLAVSDAECVSDDPIHLTVYSPNVPDLSLIDLPGYIQVIGQNQPLQLKLKISELCEKYIQPPNVILAISAADVDLANSTALRASRRVDPRGDRTIGVITKMDLVDPGKGAAILNDKQYPLRLGYVGVVSKAHQSPGLFKMGLTNPMAVIAKHEYSFFSAHPLEYGPDSGVSVGTTTLRRKLMQVLEQTMSSSLQGTSDAVKKELDEADYEFKVQYNGRPLSAEAYLAEGLDAFKHSFRKFANGFRRPEMLELLKNELDQEVLNVLAAKYWNKLVEEDLSATHPDPNPIANLPQADPSSVHWHAKLDASTSALTRLGVGRLGTTVVASSLKSHIDKLIDNSNFATHPFAKKAVKDAAAATLDEMFLVTCDKVESYLKPFKFEIDVEKREWEQGRQHVGKLLKEELRECKAVMGSLESAAGGRRKLMEVMGFVDKARRGDIVIEGDGRSNAGEFSPALLSKGREAVFLRDRAHILGMRLAAIKSKQCASVKNKYYCPEVFLDAAASQMAETAVLFLNVELLFEFYYKFPRELDLRLGRLSQAKAEEIAKEDPKIRRHLEVFRRKELLGLVLEKIESLRQLEGRGRERLAGGRKHE